MSPRALALFTEIEPCSLESYAHLDGAEACQSTPHGESGTHIENLAPPAEPDPNNTEDRHDT